MREFLLILSIFVMSFFPVILVPHNVVGAEQASRDYSPRYLPICSNSKRVNCIVDGDTLWLDGVKMRLKGIDAPEARHHADCLTERALATTATSALQSLISDRDITVRTFGKGRFGRLLVKIHSSCGSKCTIDVGQSLLDSDLAQPWPNSGNRWCGR